MNILVVAITEVNILSSKAGYVSCYSELFDSKSKQEPKQVLYFLLLFMMIPLFHSERDIPNMIQKAHVQHLRIPKDHCVSQRFPHTAKTRAEIELKSITGVLQEAHDNAMTMKMQCYVCIVLFSFICKTHAFIHTYANIFFADVNV